MSHELFAAVQSAAIIADPNACRTEYYMKPFFQIVVPRPYNTSIIYCTRDASLYADYAANGFCHMTAHSPAAIFSSPAWYDCPGLNPDAARFSKGVLLTFLMIAMPCVAGVGFLLGAAYLASQIRMDVLDRSNVYPAGLLQRSALVIGMGFAATLFSFPWLIQWLGTVVWLVFALFVKIVFDFNMRCSLTPGVFDFWRPFKPLGRRIRAQMGGRERASGFGSEKRWQGVDPTVWEEEFEGKTMPPYIPSVDLPSEDRVADKRIIKRSNTF